MKKAFILLSKRSHWCIFCEGEIELGRPLPNVKKVNGKAFQLHPPTQGPAAKDSLVVFKRKILPGLSSSKSPPDYQRETFFQTVSYLC